MKKICIILICLIICTLMPTAEASGMTVDISEENILTLTGDAETLYTLIVYKPKNTADVVMAFTDTYLKEDYLASLTENQTDVSGILSDYRVIGTDDTGTFKSELNLIDYGAYRIEIIREETGEFAYANVANKQEIIFSSDGEKNMASPLFPNVLAKFTKKSETDIQGFYQTYCSLTNKARVANILKNEKDGLNRFYAAVMIEAMFENAPSFDERKVEDICIEQLKFCNIDSTPVTLFINSEHKEQILSRLEDAKYKNMNGFMTELLEICILDGISSVQNYRNAKTYLACLNNADYDKCDNKDKLAELIVKNRPYDTIEDLNLAVSRAAKDIDSGAYNDNKGSGSGGGSVGGGGSKTPNTGWAVSQPTEPDTRIAAFSDVPESHWGFSYVENLASKGIISGNENKMFEPERSVTRAEFLKMICNAFGIEQNTDLHFNDVDPSSWYAGYVGAASELGIVLGADGNFYPDSVITREDACVIIYRAARVVGLMISDGTSDFIDKEEISSYATDAIGALNGSGIINGIGEGRFAPKENLSRAAAAKIVCMISERSERT